MFTDLKSHGVTSATGRDGGKEWDTPSLVECWRTAPYLFDGRAATMRDVLTTFNKDDNHGVTSTLTAAQLDELIEYVLSL